MSGIIFSPELAAKALTGTKTVTRRPISDNPRSPWSPQMALKLPGKTRAVQPGRGQQGIGRILILDVQRECLRTVCRGYEARREGFPDWLAFADYWRRMYGSFDEWEWVWRVSFRAVVG